MHVDAANSGQRFFRFRRPVHDQRNVEPGRESALIGAIVLEDLDFLVDCAGQRLVPRDPKHIISEVE